MTANRHNTSPGVDDRRGDARRSERRKQARRCFYALALSDQAEQALVETIGRLRLLDRDDVRWTPRNNLHVTLRFLGEIDEDQFEEASYRLNGLNIPPLLELTAAPLTAFPSLRRPNVVVVELEGRTEHDRKCFSELHERMEDLAQALGLRPEERPFRPHVTLGRVRPGSAIGRPLREELQLSEPPRELPESFSGRSLLLMESILKPQGAEYRAVVERGIGVESMVRSRHVDS